MRLFIRKKEEEERNFVTMKMLAMSLTHPNPSKLLVPPQTPLNEGALFSGLPWQSYRWECCYLRASSVRIPRAVEFGAAAYASTRLSLHHHVNDPFGTE